MDSGGQLMISVTVQQVQSIVGIYLRHLRLLRAHQAWKSSGRK